MQHSNSITVENRATEIIVSFSMSLYSSTWLYTIEGILLHLFEKYLLACQRSSAVLCTLQCHMKSGVISAAQFTSVNCRRGEVGGVM